MLGASSSRGSSRMAATMRERAPRSRRLAAVPRPVVWIFAVLLLAQVLPDACDRVTPGPPKLFGEACPKPGISQCYVPEWHWWGWVDPLVARLAPSKSEPVSNSLGYVEIEADRTPRPGTFRMIAVGGSTTMNSVRRWREMGRGFDEESYVKHLARAADARYGELAFEGLAMATSGWSLPDVRAAVESEALAYAPHLVLVGEPVNWLTGGYYYGPRNEPKDFGRPVLIRATPLNRFNLIRTFTGVASLARLLLTIHGTETAYGRPSSQRGASLPGLEEDLQAIYDAVVVGAKLPLILVVFGTTFEAPGPAEEIVPQLEERKPGMGYAALHIDPHEGNAAVWDLLQAYNRELRDFGATHPGVLLIDGDAYWNTHYPRYQDRASVFADSIHLTDLGKSIMASELLLPALRQLVPDVPERDLPPLVERVAGVELPSFDPYLDALAAQQASTAAPTTRRVVH